MWEDRLLFTGETKREAYEKAKSTLNTIEAKLSLWKNTPIKLCNIEEMKPTTIGGTIYYYNIVKPLAVWEGVGKCDFSKISYDRQDIYKKLWKKDVELQVLNNV